MKDEIKDFVDSFANLCEIYGKSLENEMKIKSVIEEELGVKTSPFLDKIQTYEGDEDYRMLLAIFTSVMLPILVYLQVLEPFRAIKYLFENFIRKKTNGNADEVIERFLHKDFKTREPEVFSRVHKRHLILVILLVLMVTWTYNTHKATETLQNCFEDYINLSHYE